MALVDRGKYRIDPTFIYHQCKAKDWTAGSNTAVMGKTLNKKTLSETRIYLPGFERQIQIAAELDYLDEQIASANAVSERLDSLVKSRFIEMFENEKQIVRLCDVCDTFNGDRGSNYPSADERLNAGIPQGLCQRSQQYRSIVQPVSL